MPCMGCVRKDVEKELGISKFGLTENIEPDFRS